MRSSLWASFGNGTHRVPPPIRGATSSGRIRPAALLLIAGTFSLVPCFSVCSAAFELRDIDARSAGLASWAGASGLPPREYARTDTSVRSDSAWSVRMRAYELFGLPELRGYGASVESRGTFSVSLDAERLGSDIYREQSVGIGLSSCTYDAGSVGVTLRALGLSGSGVTTVWTCAVDASAGLRLLERIHISCVWQNVGGSRIGGSPVSTPAIFAASLRSGSALLSGSCLMEQGLRPSTSLGCELELSRWMTLRAGMATSPGVFAAGLGVPIPSRLLGVDECIVDVAWQWHPQLGASSFVSLSFIR